MYQAMYKCRLCGELFAERGDSIEQDKASHIINRLISEENTNLGNLPYWGHRYANHICKDGFFGFADFQGFKKVEL